MIVKYVRQLPRTRSNNIHFLKKTTYSQKQTTQKGFCIENDTVERKKDFLYPLFIEITQRYGVVDYEYFFSKQKK
jgi:hypothetical protein